MVKKIDHLLIDAGPLKGQHLVVPEEGLTVGRGPNIDLIVDHDSISRKHCRFFFRAGALWVADSGSVDGTTVNGESVESCELEKGDRVLAGCCRFRVLRTGLAAASPLRERLSKPQSGPQPTKPPHPLRGFLHGLAWVALLAWWLLLAYSLFLPPPPPIPPPVLEDVAAPIEPPVMVESPPAQSEPEPVPEEPVVAAPAPEGPVLMDMRESIAKAIVAEDFARCASLIAANQGAEQTPEEQAALAALAAYVAEVKTINTRIADALREQAGRRITLQQNGRVVPFRVVAVTPTRLRGVLLSPDGDSEWSVDISKLHPLDRLRWLGTPATPAQHAMHVGLELKSGNREQALEHARAAGDLSDALVAIVGAP